DDKTFDHCKSQIMEYKRAIEREGLPTFVLAANWINPQDIRLKLQEFHRNQHLEGVLLLGNIPDVHLTFGKNKLQSFLSDRFYDTFDVELTFLGTQPGATAGRPIPIYTIPDSAPTRFRSTLYSARLRLDETLEEEVAFGQLSAFLEKAAQAHVEAISLRTLLYVHQAPSALTPSARAKDMELWLAQTERLEEQFRSSIDDRVRIRFVHPDRLMESSNIPFEDPLKFPQLDLAFVHG